jgi:hypothetical protein
MRFRCGIPLIFGLIAVVFLTSVDVARTQSRKALSAPTYYLAIKADLEDSDTIRVRGATNLPAGAKIAVGVGELIGDFGLKPYSDGACATVNDKGLFELELHTKSGMKFRRNLNAGADFSVNGACKQPPSVLAVVGKKGQHLGNDNYDDAADTTMAETPGMFENPQLYQSSGWHFGLGVNVRVE